MCGRSAMQDASNNLSTDVSSTSLPLKRRRYIRRALVALLFAATVIVYLLLYAQTSKGVLTVTFLDVGQGDAILIESPTGVQLLIDGGPNAVVLRQLAKEMGFFDRSIDMVLATHPDQDHIGGLSDVLNRYEVAEIIMTENTSDTSANQSFREYVTSEGATVVYARRGMRFDLGGGVMLTVLFPDRDPTFLESNTSSIVARLTFGDTEFLFTGDSPQAIEQYLVTLGDDLESDVLKAGHHGSDTSTSEEFIEVVQPSYAVISAGKDNRYGHPTKRVMDAFVSAGVITKNTAESGSITFVSDGVSVVAR